MPKNTNMGRKSHHAQDAQYEQNVKRLAHDIPDQRTRPTVHPQEASHSSEEEPRETK